MIGGFQLAADLAHDGRERQHRAAARRTCPEESSGWTTASSPAGSAW